MDVEKHETRVDIAFADKIKADIESGREELIPAEIVEALLSGENPIRVWRNYRGLTATALAEQTKLSSTCVSEIESGKIICSNSTIKRIASALRVDINDLI